MRRGTERIAAVVVMTGLAVNAVMADDWPHWRGPQRDGRSRETALLDQWPVGGPPKVWMIDDAGVGYSAPAVVGQRLYVTGADDTKEWLMARSVADGRLLWRVDLGRRFRNDWGDGPRAAPTVDGQHVYALGGDGRLVCAQTETGQVVWSVEMRGQLGGKLASVRIDWGYSEGPLVDADRLIVSPGGPQGTVAALDKATGKVLWRSTALPEPVSYSSLIATEAAGVRQYVVITDSGVVAGLAANDGRLLWTHRNPACRGIFVYCSTPLVRDNEIYVSCGYGIGCDLLRVSQTAKPVVEVVYTNREMINHHGGMVLIEGRIYGYSDGRGWVCQDWATGQTLWRNKDDLGKGCVIAANGQLYCLAEQTGEVALVAANPDSWSVQGRFVLPRLSRRRPPRGKVWTHPVIANGKLYLRDQEFLYCYDISAKPAKP